MDGLSGFFAGALARREGSFFGPTLGTVQDFGQVTGAVSTGEFRASDTRALRRLMPYQNLFYIRSLFDNADGPTTGVPGSRKISSCPGAPLNLCRPQAAGQPTPRSGPVRFRPRPP